MCVLTAVYSGNTYKNQELAHSDEKTLHKQSLCERT